ncbi:carbamoyltransferase [Amycolatopsis antarctica]|uniref:Carbamoyltransferase n=1 Tax=Amycolatopsis antarctica TaxID=1854586 RepID=A0A263D0I9_9PSEU|nr:carbamoyltransferase C-terminal domain-containing protein [Amycolatopsis antarctica]OZM71147.1 carbamoyltransferase [Amycolatopsis antarctica]
MYVIGISGMHNSIDFKKRELPGLDPRHYRIVQGLDAAAALVSDEGVVAAAAEERFTGEKTTGGFPVNAIRFCLEQAGITMSDVDHVAHGFDYRPSAAHELNDFTAARFHEVYASTVQRESLAAHWPELDWERRFVPVPHHLAHAASTFHLSGFDESLILVADGMGETESMTVAVGRGRDIEVVRTVPALHSLGTLYGAVTLYLGFEFGMDEYKVMGLAPYGDRERFFADVMGMIRLGEHGSYLVPALAAANRDWREHETLDGVVRTLTERFGSPRSPGEPIEQRHMDVAAGVQAGLQATLLHVLRAAKEDTGQRNLCMAGGVALNCTANGLISRSRMFEGLFVQPASGDDGSALGAALRVHTQRSGIAPAGRMAMPFWGPGYSGERLAAAASGDPGCQARAYPDFDALAKEVSGLIAGGAVVAWFQDRMEFGPRALGNRSILADPRSAGMRDHLNAIVKQREDFRPFAPVVRAEDVHRFFEIVPGVEERYAHMLFVVRTRPEHRDTLPAVTHVDGTARVQVVRREDNARLWTLLGAFGERTGVPVLLNTSFNLRGQPVICDPELAMRTYAGSRLDHLVLGDNLVSKVGADARVPEPAAGGSVPR